MMDALPMDDVPPCADCTEAEDNDHLNQLANVAVGAAQAAALKRRAESTAGRDVCCVVGKNPTTFVIRGRSVSPCSGVF